MSMMMMNGGKCKNVRQFLYFGASMLAFSYTAQGSHTKCRSVQPVVLLAVKPAAFTAEVRMSVTKHKQRYDSHL